MRHGCCRLTTDGKSTWALMASCEDHLGRILCEGERTSPVCGAGGCFRPVVDFSRAQIPWSLAWHTGKARMNWRNMVSGGCKVSVSIDFYFIWGMARDRSRAQWLHCTSPAVSPMFGRIKQKKDWQNFGEKKALHPPPLTSSSPPSQASKQCPPLKDVRHVSLFQPCSDCMVPWLQPYPGYQSLIANFAQCSAV